MRFSYKAVNKDGKTLEGTSEAANKEALIAMLTKQGARPLIIKADHGKASSHHSLGGKVKLRDLAAFTRQLSVMISAGVPLARAFQTLQQQTNNKYFKTVIGKVTKDVESGIALGDAFAKHPAVFSDVYVNMVRAGETGGILDEILKRLSAQLEQDASMRKKLKSAMIYPTVILVITILAFFGIMMFVIPQIGSILKELGGPNTQLPPQTRLMIGISDFLRSSWYIIFAVLGGGVFMLRRFIRTPAGKLKFHKLLLKIPLVKTVITKIAVARFARTFASLLAAGVNMLDALEVTGGAMGNKVIEAELNEAAKEVKNGKQLSEPLSNSKHFPPIVAQMIAIGEETGQIDVILVKVADFYEEEVTTTVEGLSSVIEPLMIVVLGSMVGLIAASVMGPIASLSKNVE